MMKFSRIKSRWLTCWLVLYLSASFLLPSLSAASSNNYNVYSYDMTTPQFTPDGRLLQVEYASSAAELSSPLVALQLSNQTLALVAMRNSNTQNRMVILDDYCVAMSGVLSDSLALMQVVLKKASEHLRQFQKRLTILQVTKAIANACQQHAFGGGIRPYGSTMLVCGYRSQQDDEATIYQTDPSGGILPAPRSSSSSSSPSMVRWVVGGNPTLQRQLRKRIESNLSRQGKKKTSLVDTLAIAAKTLIKETQKNSKTTNNSNIKKQSTSLEVVILSSTLGCHRLTKDQLDAVVERIG